MRAPSLVLVSSFVVAMLGGCDDPKKDPAKASPSATPSVVPSAAVASATPSASTEAPKPKAAVLCGTGPELDTKDAALAEEIRRKLGKKPGEAVKNTELATIRSLNLIKTPASCLSARQPLRSAVQTRSASEAMPSFFNSFLSHSEIQTQASS